MSKRGRRPANFKVFDNFSYFIPGGWGFAGLCLWLIVGSLLGNVISAVFLTVSGGKAMEAAMLVSYPMIFIPAMIYSSFKSSRNQEFETGYSIDSTHFKPTKGLVCVLLAVISTLALNFIASYFVCKLPPMPQWLEDALKNMTQGSFWINFISVSIFAPLFEEWLCRGMVLRGLLNHRRENGKTMHPAWAIVISAAFFAVIHLNPWQAIAAFLLGCLFGFVYWKTGSLKLTMLLHCVNNSFALILGQIPSLKDVEDWRTVMSATSFWICFILCLLAVAFTVYQFSKIKNSLQGNCDKLEPLFPQE